MVCSLRYQQHKLEFTFKPVTTEHIENSFNLICVFVGKGPVDWEKMRIVAASQSNTEMYGFLVRSVTFLLGSTYLTIFWNLGEIPVGFTENHYEISSGLSFDCTFWSIAGKFSCLAWWKWRLPSEWCAYGGPLMKKHCLNYFLLWACNWGEGGKEKHT